MIALRSSILGLLLLALVRPAFAAPVTALEAQLRALTAGYGGKVALYAVDVTSGRDIALNADTPVPTASVIKYAVLFEALEQCADGRVRLDDRLTMTKADQVPGSGVLRYFDTPHALTFKDALAMMIQTSDNTATNLVIDHLGLANIDRRLQWLGLTNTWLYKKVFTAASGPMPSDQATFGLGKTTAREMAQIARRIAACDLAAPGSETKPTARERALCATADAMLEAQFDGNSMPRYLRGVKVAHKTGSLDDVRNDVGVVYAKGGPIVIAAFTYDNVDTSWTPDTAGELLIGRLARSIVDAWK